VATPINPLPLPSNELLVFLRDRQRYPRAEDKDPKEGRITPRWQEYLDREAANLSKSTTLINSASALNQSASIAATDFSGAALPAGTYEFEWFATVKTAAGVSSSLIVTVDFVYSSVTKTLSYTAMTGNTTGTFAHSGGIIVIDNASPVRYSTTYASNAAGAMHYDLFLVLRRVDA